MGSWDGRRVSLRGIGAGRCPFLVRLNSPAPSKRPALGADARAAHESWSASRIDRNGLSHRRYARPTSAPAPSGMTGARADGAFAFVGAPMPVKAALPRNRKRGYCRMAAAGISLMRRRHDLRRACASVLSVARRRRGRGGGGAPRATTARPPVSRSSRLRPPPPLPPVVEAPPQGWAARSPR